MQGPSVPATTLGNYICPTCKEQFSTLEEIGEHYAAAHGTATHVAPAEGAESMEVEMEVRRVVKHICPDCGAAYCTTQEVRQHWLTEHYDTSVELVTDEEGEAEEEEAEADAGGDKAVPASTKVERAQAQLIEADDQGRPVIVRHTQPATGATRTVVMNDDGSQRIFGEDTVISMMTRTEVDLEQWIAAMTDRHLRGLLNELSTRLCENSQKLHERRQELDVLSRQANFAFFGLSEGVPEKDLDNAYRKLARTMHPDKNGGTEEAKLRFQGMKGKYEELKSQLANGSLSAARPPAASEQASQKAERGAEQEAQETSESKEPGVDGAGGAKEAAEGAECKEDEATAAASAAQGQAPQGQAPEGSAAAGRQVGGAATTAAASPFGREVLEQKAWKMLRQLKMIGQNLRIVESSFQQVQAEVVASE